MPLKLPSLYVGNDCSHSSEITIIEYRLLILYHIIFHYMIVPSIVFQNFSHIDSFFSSISQTHPNGSSRRVQRLGSWFFTFSLNYLAETRRTFMSIISALTNIPMTWPSSFRMSCFLPASSSWWCLIFASHIRQLFILSSASASGYSRKIAVILFMIEPAFITIP